MAARESGYPNLPNEVDPSAAMLRVLWAGWLSAAVCVAAKLGIADELVKGPMTADEVAGYGQCARTITLSLASRPRERWHFHRGRPAQVCEHAPVGNAQKRSGEP